jgi:hypothetical protein
LEFAQRPVLEFAQRPVLEFAQRFIVVLSCFSTVFAKTFKVFLYFYKHLSLVFWVLGVLVMYIIFGVESVLKARATFPFHLEMD